MTTLSEKRTSHLVETKWTPDGDCIETERHFVYREIDVREVIKKLKEKLPNACIDALDNEYYPQNLIDDVFGEELTREEEQK